ncbi:MAG: hypothetical protein NVSMB1_12330 [Polyangiales bacterium]
MLVFAMILLPAAFNCDGAQAPSDKAPPDDSPRETPVRQLIGEIHLHQFPLGSHAWAGFLQSPVPLARTHPDQLIEYELPPSRREGPCTLYLEPTCKPMCLATSYCSATNVCAPFEPLHYVDAGAIEVLGSSVLPRLRLFFRGEDRTYDSEPLAGAIQLFKGNERLRLRGGRGEFAFDSTMQTPTAVTVTSPNLRNDLHLPLDDEFTVAWVSEQSLSMVVLITVARNDGPLGYIRCNTADVGSLVVPRAMMVALPRPPRDTRLEVERYEERVFPTSRPGVGILVNIAQSTWESGKD